MWGGQKERQLTICVSEKSVLEVTVTLQLSSHVMVEQSLKHQLPHLKTGNRKQWESVASSSTISTSLNRLYPKKQTHTPYLATHKHKTDTTTFIHTHTHPQQFDFSCAEVRLVYRVCPQPVQHRLRQEEQGWNVVLGQWWHVQRRNQNIQTFWHEKKKMHKNTLLYRTRWGLGSDNWPVALHLMLTMQLEHPTTVTSKKPQMKQWKAVHDFLIQSQYNPWSVVTHW